MSNVYEALGVPTVINAVGPSTRLSGGIMRPEVAEAMAAASQHCVDIAQLQARASQVIAEYTGAEAGYVTSGAAAGLLLGTAACVTGLDPGKMNRLPDTMGMKNEVIMARSHRNFYDHAVRSVGIKLVEVGIADRFSGAGVRDAEGWEIGAAVNERTAAVVYVAYAHTQPPLDEVIAAAHAHGVPVIVDAAGQVPPVDNLRRFIAEGADLVAFSGGKAIGGPQSSGILCGRADLITSVALQHLDLDVMPALWNPPPELIDRAQLPGAPQHGIGRPCKVGKEEIVGLLTALRLFVEEDPAVRHQRWLDKMTALVQECGTLAHATAEVVADRKRVEVPTVRLTLDEESAGLSALELVRALEEGTPSIAANPTYVQEGVVVFGPMCLRSGEESAIAARLRALLGT
ncbi:MAG: aminotransferase class V-fold PLP-dependent enzyme [Candidatus Latescibacterota bacterium]|nr:aminotransferase class V-fold PLP-dependent enzyme [Candidatus Latescibacterota bacterium]